MSTFDPSTRFADDFQDPAAKEQARTAGRFPRIFFLLDSLNIGGTENQAVELACRLKMRNYPVTLGCLRRSGPLLEKVQSAGIVVHEFYPRGGIDSITGSYQLFRLTAFLMRERFELVHTHDLWSNLLGVPAAWLARIPAIISSRRDLSHLDWYQSGRGVWLRRIQKLSDIVLTNATSIRDQLISEDGFSPRKVRVVHNGIDVQRFAAARTDRARVFHGEGKLVVLVGNMHSEIKGHAVLIGAAQPVIQSFPNTRFVLAGDGQFRPGFERRVAELRLTENFIFLGQRADIPEILASCDMAVLPSQAEGLSNAILEYMAAGLPTIATRVGGNAELIQDGVTGLLVPANDSRSLADALLRLLREPELARRLAYLAHEFVTQNFSFERMLDQTEQLYREMLERADI